MSKVQTAVERAKKLRQSETATDEPREIMPRRRASAATLPAAKPAPPIKIEGLATVEVDSETLKRNRIVTFDDPDKHPVQNAYRMLRTRLMQNMRTNSWRVLGVSSIRENEGKTFTAINLAISIAAELGQEAVLVDLDLRKPSIHRYLGIEPQQVSGLKEYFENDQSDVSELLICPEIDRLGLLLSANPLARSSDILASDRGQQLFAELRTRLSDRTVIIVDLPPLLAADDALAVAPLLDALLLVVAEGQSERADIQEARYLLEAFTLIGTVLNKSSDKESKRKSYYY
jgi:capsular exopolysaccharide synthesis family protein